MGGAGMEFVQGSPRLVGQAGPLGRDCRAVLEQLFVGPVLGWLEVVVELPLFKRCQLSIETIVVFPEAPELLVGSEILFVVQSGHTIAAYETQLKTLSKLALLT